MLHEKGYYLEDYLIEILVKLVVVALLVLDFLFLWLDQEFSLHFQHQRSMEVLLMSILYALLILLSILLLFQNVKEVPFSLSNK